ncbi:M14 family zinc carboxypeptidase [Nonlabens antarcticus]|uniref:M14 family zinc carboxypeptidase n=1 Tax=Nonlabens antarcticus TaxID=392714 RepID=UPI001890BD9A|nr:M14 family zinc carboxypeptidase [Nonlabens antarcticus]
MMNEPIATLEPLSRYFTYTAFEEHFMAAVKALPPDQYAFSFLGSSVDNQSIYGLRLGHGAFKILAWSQMHGNESTSTRAIIDLLHSKDLFQALKNISLYIIPVLNPDGLSSWSRFNSNGIDLNRDAVNLSQPESVILKEVIDFYEPDLALNLHGQRTFYGIAGSVLPAQLSFLTPAADVSKGVNASRLKSMALINNIVKTVKPQMQTAIARYDDSFNVNCWGDYCQSVGIPTLLFEAGHAGDDYARDEVKTLIISSLKSVFTNCSKDEEIEEEVTLNQYLEIPEIARNYCDILIRNAPSVKGNRDLAIMYHEQIEDSQLHFIPMLFAVNDSTIIYGHRMIDLKTDLHYSNDLEVHENMTVTSASLKIGAFIK